MLKGLYFQNSEASFQEALSSGDIYVMHSEDGVLRLSEDRSWSREACFGGVDSLAERVIQSFLKEPLRKFFRELPFC